MSDLSWLDDLEHSRAWIEAVRHDALPKLPASAVSITINPGQEIDLKVAVELGMTILLDKPLLVINYDSQPIAEHLRRAADLVIEEPATHTGHRRAQKQISDFLRTLAADEPDAR